MSESFRAFGEDAISILAESRIPSGRVDTGSATLRVKIGYSVTLWDESRTGIGTYIAQQIAELERRDDPRVRLLQFGGGALASDARPSTTGTQPGVAGILRPLRDIWWHRFQLKRLAGREGFDLVHVPCIRRLPAGLPCPTVVTIHDLGPVRLAGKYGFLRGIYWRILPRWLRGIDAIITPSESTKSDLVELLRVEPEKITVIRNGLDHAFYRPGDPAESLALLQKQYPLRPPFFV